MIERFQVKNYKALRDVTLDLTPIHVLIGPNDSGKTSILEAIAALCRSVDHRLPEAFLGRWEGSSLVWQNDPGTAVEFVADVALQEQSFRYSLSVEFNRTRRAVVLKQDSAQSGGAVEVAPLKGGSGEYSSVSWHIFHTQPNTPPPQREWAERVRRALGGVHYYRWDSRFLALPAAPDAKRRFRMESSGFGLALCLDDILGYDRQRFTDLENRFKTIFPDIKSIKLIAEPAYRAPADDPQQIPMLQQADGKGIHFEFTSGQVVPASQVSDGVLLVLAYLTVLYLPEPPRVILVEEPENGIHPNRLRDVLSILRDLVNEQSQTQVVMTTHSPYVVDLFEPSEVTLCSKEPDGSVSVRRLSDSAAVREQMDVFTLGEIWTGTGDEALAKAAAANGSGGE